MATLTGKFESKKQDWTTPSSLYSALDNEFNFNFDLAADETNAKCPNYFTMKDDALKQEWHGRCWLNPPYGYDRDHSLSNWARYAFEQSRQHNDCLVVMLLPARTNTNWWHDYCMKAKEVRFLCGRPKFGNSVHGLPQPLALIVFDNPANYVTTEFSSYVVPANKK